MIVLKVILFMLFITGLHCRHPDKVYCVNEGCDGALVVRTLQCQFSCYNFLLLNFISLFQNQYLKPELC